MVKVIRPGIEKKIREDVRLMYKKKEKAEHCPAFVNLILSLHDHAASASFSIFGPES